MARGAPNGVDELLSLLLHFLGLRETHVPQERVLWVSVFETRDSEKCIAGGRARARVTFSLLVATDLPQSLLRDLLNARGCQTVRVREGETGVVRRSRFPSASGSLVNHGDGHVCVFFFLVFSLHHLYIAVILGGRKKKKEWTATTTMERTTTSTTKVSTHALFGGNRESNRVLQNLALIIPSAARNSLVSWTTLATESIETRKGDSISSPPRPPRNATPPLSLSSP